MLCLVRLRFQVSLAGWLCVGNLLVSMLISSPVTAAVEPGTAACERAHSPTRSVRAR